MDNHVAGNVRRLREQRNWTQEELGAVACISTRSIQRLEAGETKPSAESLRGLLQAFEIEADELHAPPPPSDEEKKAAEVLSRYEFIRLGLLGRGSDLGRMLGAHAIQFDAERLADDAQEDTVAEFRQNLTDWNDLWRDLEPLQQRDGEKNMGSQIRALADCGLVVGAARAALRVRMHDGKPMELEIIYVRVSRAAEPQLLAIRDRKAAVRFS